MSFLDVALQFCESRVTIVLRMAQTPVAVRMALKLPKFPANKNICTALERRPIISFTPSTFFHLDRRAKIDLIEFPLATDTRIQSSTQDAYINRRSIFKTTYNKKSNDIMGLRKNLTPHYCCRRDSLPCELSQILIPQKVQVHTNSE